MYQPKLKTYVTGQKKDPAPTAPPPPPPPLNRQLTEKKVHKINVRVILKPQQTIFIYYISFYFFETIGLDISWELYA